MFLAFSHSALPVPTGHAIASETSLKISMPISNATAAPMKLKMNPRLSTIDRNESSRLFKILNGLEKKRKKGIEPFSSIVDCHRDFRRLRIMQRTMQLEEFQLL